ncbi:hypothetical protein Dimus_030901 [Dionaea muscipula]
MAPTNTYTQVIESPVAPARLFKAIVLDSHNLLPKLIPDTFESIEIVEGDSIAVGSVMKINFPKGHHNKYIKHRIDELDVDTLYYKYTITESDVPDCKYEYIFEAAAGSGSIFKVTTHFSLKEGVEIDEEKINFKKAKLRKYFKIVEEYLVANPKAYA